MPVIFHPAAERSHRHDVVAVHAPRRAALGAVDVVVAAHVGGQHHPPLIDTDMSTTMSISAWRHAEAQALPAVPQPIGADPP